MRVCLSKDNNPADAQYTKRKQRFHVQPTNNNAREATRRSRDEVLTQATGGVPVRKDAVGDVGVQQQHGGVHPRAAVPEHVAVVAVGQSAGRQGIRPGTPCDSDARAHNHNGVSLCMMCT